MCILIAFSSQHYIKCCINKLFIQSQKGKLKISGQLLNLIISIITIQGDLAIVKIVDLVERMRK